MANLRERTDRANQNCAGKSNFHCMSFLFVLSVALEKEVGAGDSIDSITKSQDGFTVAEVVNLYAVDANNQGFLRRATQSSVLAESWKDYFRRRLWEPDAGRDS